MKRSSAITAVAFGLLSCPATIAASVPTRGDAVPLAPRTPYDYLSRPAPMAPPTPSAVQEPPPPGSSALPLAKWTYLVYMDGDNDLEPYITSDLETELAAQGSDGDVNVVALADRSPAYDTSDGDWSDTRLFYVTAGMRGNPESAQASWGERNMGDPQTLIDFLDYARTWFPAERYALLFWDHGWSWRPGQTMWDESDNDALDLDEAAYALQQTGPVDVIGYDACLMATLEVEATFRPYARALAVSEDYVGYEGFAHDQVIAALREDPAMDGPALATVLAGSMRDRTISAIVLDERFDALEAAVDQLAGALMGGLTRYRSAYDAARTATPDFGDKATKDLYQLAVELQARVADPNVRAACQAVIDAYPRVVLAEWHRDFYRAIYGTTLYWPKEKGQLDATSSPVYDWDWYRSALTLSRQTRWDEFVAAWLKR